MRDTGQTSGIQDSRARLRRRQAQWNRTQFLSLSAQHMSTILEDLALSTRYQEQASLARIAG